MYLISLLVLIINRSLVDCSGLQISFQLEIILLIHFRLLIFTISAYIEFLYSLPIDMVCFSIHIPKKFFTVAIFVNFYQIYEYKNISPLQNSSIINTITCLTFQLSVACHIVYIVCTRYFLTTR